MKAFSGIGSLPYWLERRNEQIAQWGAKVAVCSLCGREHVTHRRAKKTNRCAPCTAEAVAIRGRAQGAAWRAVQRGELPHPSTIACADCMGTADRYDHRDYSKPLDVVAVCAGCNVKRGAGRFGLECRTA